MLSYVDFLFKDFFISQPRGYFYKASSRRLSSIVRAVKIFARETEEKQIILENIETSQKDKPEKTLYDKNVKTCY